MLHWTTIPTATATATTAVTMPKPVTLVVATTADPASIGPASSLLAMPGWLPRPSFQGMISFANKEVRLLQHDNSIVAEDDLDSRWEQAIGEVVDEVIFLSKHTAVSNRPALTIHPIGVPHLREGDAVPQGGRPGWAALPDPRMGPWIRLLKRIAESRGLTPEFEITMEATHHGPVTSKPTMFLEIGSTMEYWRRRDAAQVMAQLVWEGLGLGEGEPVGKWSSEIDKKKVLLGVGGGHYVPRHMDIILKENVWVGHLLSGYSLPMEDPAAPGNLNEIGGTWKEAIRASYEATKAAFPGGEILAHLDHKSFKSWQKNVIVAFLDKENIKIGKPKDFN
ncbi:D-aminoacyl-tRNA deacylase-like protein [Drosera capensis]